MHPPAAEWSSPSKVTPEEATTGEQQHNNNNSGYAITREIAKHDDWNSTEIEFSETEVDLSNCRRLGSPVDPIHASNSIQKPSVVEVRVDYGFHA